MKFARCLAMLGTAVAVAGCVGISTHTSTKSSQGTSGTVCGLVFGEDQAPLDQASVRKACGKPIREETSGNDIRWYYRDSLAWRGVVIWAVVLPIPLLVPVGYNAKTVAFNGQSLRWVESERAGEGTFVGCGPFFGHVDWSCGKSTRE